MKYIKTYQLFEAATRQSVTDEIVNALENTVEGKDLLALANRLTTSGDLYKARRTGRVEINNLRGKTYITQLENGKWYHAVEATGRTYGEGIYDSLTDCIRGVWIDFITNSTSIRPQGMPIKEYKKFVDQEINNLIGKNLDIPETRKHFSKAYFGGKEPMDEHSPIFSSPRWKQILNFIGLVRREKSVRDSRIEIVCQSFANGFWNYTGNKTDSPLIKLADIVLQSSGNRGIEGASLYDLHFRNVPIAISFSEVPKKLKMSYFMSGVDIHVGDTIEKCKEVETTAAKAFIELKSSVDTKYIDNELPDKKQIHMYEILKAFVRFAMDIFAKGMEGEDEIEISDTVFFKLIAKEMKGLSIPAEGLSNIRKNLPELWNIYKNLSGNDPGGLETLADLGELGF
jgi:hypothetical protein